MKNKKNLIFSLSIVMLFALVITLVLKNASFAVPADNVFKDFQDIPIPTSTDYSYSTLVFNENTTFVDESGNATGSTTIAGITVPTYGWIKTGKVQLLIKNGATDANGNILNVRVVVDDIRLWDTDSDGVVLNLRTNVLLSPDQTSPDPNTVTTHNFVKGDPIFFSLHTRRADCSFRIVYLNQDGTVATQVNKISSLYYDMDVPYGGSTVQTSLFLNGNEGFQPYYGDSTLYYNKRHSQQGSDYTAVLDEVSGGLSVSSLTDVARVQGANTPLFQTSAVVHTSSPGDYRFRYGGRDAGIFYAFISPVPFAEPQPSKKVIEGNGPFYVGDTFTYRVSRYAPNNYFAENLNYHQVYNGYPEHTVYSEFVLGDVIDSHLTINRSNIKVYNEAGTDVTSYFTIGGTGQTVTATAKAANLSSSNFYGHYYNLDIPVTFSTYKDGDTIPNTGTATTTVTGYTQNVQNTNSIDTNVRYKLKVNHYIVNVATNNDNDNLSPTSWTTTAVPDNCSSVTTVNLKHGQSYTTNACANLNQYFRLRVVKNAKTATNNDSPNLISNVNADGSYKDTPHNGTYTNTINETDVDGSTLTINYYYERKPAKVLVNHLVYGSREQVPGCEATTTKTLQGISYTTDWCSPVGYTRKEVDSNYDPASGTVTKDTMSVVYLYEPSQARLVIHHYLEGTTDQVHADDVYTDYQFGDTYPMPKHSSPNYYLPSELSGDYTDYYEWNGVLPTNYQGTFNAESITDAPGTITVTYYYREKVGSYVVHHYLLESPMPTPPTRLCEDGGDSNLPYGYEYETDVCRDILDLYEEAKCPGAPSVVPSNAVGIINSSVVEVTYCYSPKTSVVTTHHYMQKHDGTKTTCQVHNNDTNNYNFGNTYTTRTYNSMELKPNGTTECPYIFKDRYEYANTSDGDSTTATVERDSYTVNYYYKPKDAIVRVYHYKEGTNESLCPSIEDTDAYYDKTINYDQCSQLSNPNYRFKAVYTNVNDNSLTINGSNVSGYVNEPIVEITYEYETIPTSYVVHHYLVDSTTKVADDGGQDDVRYGSIYETHPKAPNELYSEYRNRYRFNNQTAGANPSGVISSDNMVITYYYEPIPVDVYVHHVDKRNPNNKVHADDVLHLRYDDPYTTEPYDSIDLDGNYKNTYSHDGVTYGDPINGTISEYKQDNTYHIYYEYDQDKSSYVIHHYVCDTTTQVSPDYISSENFGSPYETHKVESSALNSIYKNNYEYSTVTTTDTDAVVNTTTGVTSGIFNKDRIEVTYCYVPKKATVTSYYYIEGSTTEVHAPFVQNNVSFGTDYSTPKYEPSDLTGDYKDNYIYSHVDIEHDPAIGNVGKSNIVVVYYYVRNPIILTTKHLIKGTSIDVSSSTCPETNEEMDRRSEYSKSKCTNLPAGYQYDNVKSTDTNTTLNQTNGTATGRITNSTTITFEYSLIGIGLTVQYYDIDTGEPAGPDKFLSMSYGDTVLERPITISNYDFVEVTIEADNDPDHGFSVSPNTGVVNGTIRKNTVIKFYYRQVLDLVVHHYINGTNDSICEDEHNRLRYNEAYEKNPCNNRLRLGRYRYVDVTSNSSDTVINDDTGNSKGNIKNNITITYYYDIPEVNTRTSKEGTTSVKLRDDLVEYTLSYDGTITGYVGHVTYKLVDKLAYHLDTSHAGLDLDGGTYDDQTKTITWIIEEDINTGKDGNHNKVITKNLKVYYRDIPVTVYKIDNNFETTTELSNYTKETTNSLTTDFELYTLTVRHRMVGEDTDIAVCPIEVTTKMNYGDPYTTVPCQALGTEYTLTAIKEVSGSTPVNGDASGTMQKDINLIYYYELTKYNYVVKHLDVDKNTELVPTVRDRLAYGTSYDEDKVTVDKYRLEDIYVSDTEATKTNDHVEGTIKDNTEVTFYYKKYLDINIKHLDVDTGALLYEETKQVPYLSNYEEYQKEFDKYLFDNVTSSDSESIITIDKVSGTIENDINITYRYKKQLNLTVKHLNKDNNEAICVEENEVLPYNTSYEKNKCSDEYLDQYIYAYVTVNPDDDTNTVNDQEAKVTGNIKDDTLVTFYYELTEITEDLKKTGPELLHSRSKAFNYTITDKVILKDYRGDSTITIKDKLEYQIDRDRSNLSGGTYNPDNRTITWTIPWNNLNTNNTSTVTKDVTINFTLYYIDVPTSVEVITNRVESLIETAKVSSTSSNYVDTTIDPFTLVVHHYKEGTTQELCPSTTELIDEGTSYTKTICNLDEYDFIEVKKNGNTITGNTGTVTENISGNTTLDFIYRKKESKLNTILTKTGPDEITDIYQEMPYDIHYEASVIDYRGNGEITITDTLPYRINTNKSNLDGGEYDGEYKIVWKVNWNDIDTYNNKNTTISVDKKIKVVFLDVNVDRKIMANYVEARTVLEDKNDLVASTKNTDIKLPGKITVHHYVNGTTDRLFDDDEEYGLVHEKYHCEPHELEGYQLVIRPTKEDVEFTLEDQEFVYTYERLSYEIKTEVVGGMGTITGNEIVYYGADSTPDNIVITPADGYEIEGVSIDGVLIDIEDTGKLIIDNFKNVKENHIVLVEFSELPIEVPITGSSTKLIIIGIIALIVNIFVAIKTGFISKVFKKSL